MRKYLILLLLAIPLLHGLLQSPSPVDASGDVVLASGTATLANTKLSLADTFAFFDFSTDMTAWVGEEIEICPATAASKHYCIRGLVSTVGTKETLGSELLDAWLNYVIWPYETWTVSGSDITQAINDAGSNGLAYKEIAQTGKLLKVAQTTYTLNSGQAPVFGWVSGCATAIGLSKGGTTYTTAPASAVSNGIGFCNSLATDFALTGTSIKQVTAPSSTGNWIKKSAASVADGDAWGYKHASFDPNDSAGFYWRVIKTRPVGTYTDGNTSVTSANIHLASVDSGAMVEVLGKDLSTYAGGDDNSTLPTRWINPHSTSAATWRTNRYLLALYSANGVATGYIGGPGAGETLSAEIATGTLTIKNLYKITATEVNHFCTGCAVGSYFTSLGTETCDANNKVQQVTDIGITGVRLHQTPNGYDRIMARTDAAFAPQAVTSYKIYQIGPSGYDLNTILQEDGQPIIGNEGATIYLQQEGS